MTTAAEVLASAAAGGSQGNPVIEAIARTRAGQAAELASVNPLILVDTIRTLAILGEHAIVDRAYTSWVDLPDGAVHFEAGLAALMARDLNEAAARLERAVTVARPQPFAWNSLALVRLARHDLDGAAAAIDKGLAAIPGDPIMSRSAAAIYALKGGSPSADRSELIALIERFMSHAQLARQAAALADTAAARALLQRRSQELDARPLHSQPAAKSLVTAPTVKRCAHVRIEPGKTFRVRVALTSAELDHVLAGNTLSFDAHLPDGAHETYLMRHDAKAVEPPPRFRLRVPEGVFTGVRQGGTVTPLFPDVPFTLELVPHGAQSKTPAPVDAANREKQETEAYGEMMGGALMIGIGALRAAAASHPSSTNTLMMLIGAGMALYGVFRWLTLPRSGGNGPTRA
jgi:hypothetical protein